MKKKVGIIGLGWVGASTAISVLHKGLCSELMLYDIQPGLAEGEAMDLQHGSAFYPTATVRAASISEMQSCHVIVVTAGVGVSKSQTRLDVLRENHVIIQQIAEQLKGYTGIVVVVTNPVDVLTYFLHRYAELPAHRVIGTGTMLDSARLRFLVGNRLGVNRKNINAQVVGEHGDSEVILWSQASAGGMQLRHWKGWTLADESTISEQVRQAALEVKKRKGVANHAIGLVTADLLKTILRGERKVRNLSTVLHGEFQLHDVALSLPVIVSENGVEEVLQIDMSALEHQEFIHSAHILKKAIAECESK